MKVLLIVFGSIFGLMLVAIIGIAIMLPMLGKKMAADSRDPAARARTTAKIAQFTIPPGYRIASATDLGITQSAVLTPQERGRGGMIIQLSNQHLPSSNPDSMLDAMATGMNLTAKFEHCDLKREADDALVAGGQPVKMRVLGCPGGSQMHVEMGIVRARASTVQIVGTVIGYPFDHATFAKFVASIK